MTTETDWQARWRMRGQRWQQAAHEAGLAGVTHALSEALRPLSPLAAQVLWISQPSLGLLGQAEAIGALADLLNELPVSTGDE